jgi:hypothetical protein
LLLLSIASAQVDETMSIESNRNVAVARSALDQSIRELGYARINIGDRSRYIHPQPWHPRIVVYDDGLFEVRARRATPLMIAPAGTVSRFPGEEERSLSVADYLSNEQDNAAGVTGLWNPQRSRARMEGDIIAAISDEAQLWQEAIRAKNRLYRDDEIRQRLYDVWEDSTRPHTERRHRVLEMWLNTTDNSDGERVREMIEIFIDDVIQASASPLTTSEIEAANAKHPWARVLEPVAPSRTDT